MKDNDNCKISENGFDYNFEDIIQKNIEDLLINHLETNSNESSIIILQKLIKNIYLNPNDEKQMKLKVSNPKIQQQILSNRCACEILEMVNFKMTNIDDIQQLIQVRDTFSQNFLKRLLLCLINSNFHEDNEEINQIGNKVEQDLLGIDSFDDQKTLYKDEILIDHNHNNFDQQEWINRNPNEVNNNIDKTNDNSNDLIKFDKDFKINTVNTNHLNNQKYQKESSAKNITYNPNNKVILDQSKYEVSQDDWKKENTSEYDFSNMTKTEQMKVISKVSKVNKHQSAQQVKIQEYRRQQEWRNQRKAVKQFKKGNRPDQPRIRQTENTIKLVEKSPFSISQKDQMQGIYEQGNSNTNDDKEKSNKDQQKSKKEKNQFSSIFDQFFGTSKNNEVHEKVIEDKNGRKHQMELKDLEEEEENFDEDWLIREGKRSLKYTNDFRGEHDLPPCKWNQQLCDIAKEHSVNMAQGKVPIGHQGFDERQHKVTFQIKSFSENVAWSAGAIDPVRLAVDGWINSPGHRKNLLSYSNICGIGIAVVGDNYQFTQLFALA